MSVTQIRPGADRAKRVRGHLIAAVRGSLRDYRHDMAGFVLVLWDGRGQCYSAMDTLDGPIGNEMAPSFARDVLSRHVAIGHAGESVTPLPDPAS